MFARTEHDSRELFPLEPRSPWHPDVAFVWLAPVIFIERTFGPLAALVAAVAYARFAPDDFLTARWIARRDPDCRRGAACFWFCLSRGALKVVVVATSLATLINNQSDWHSPLDWKVPTALLAGVVVHVALAVVGWRSATRQQVRVWIDCGLNRARQRKNWPPRCWDANNQAKNLGLVITVLLVIFVLGADALEAAFTSSELPAAGILTAPLLGLLLLTRRAAAVTPWACWAVSRAASIGVGSHSSHP